MMLSTVVIFFLMTYILYNYNKRGVIGKLSLKILNKILPILSNIFFLPTVFFFFVMFDCTEGNNNFINGVKCWSGTLFYVNIFLCAILESFFLIITTITQIIYYDFYQSTSNNNNLIKNTSTPDVIFLWIKAINVIIFIICDTSNYHQWILMIDLIGGSLAMFIMNFKYQRYKNSTIMFLHKFFSAIYLWIVFILTIGKIIFETSIDFDGCLALIFIGIPFIYLILIIEKKYNTQFFFENLSKINDHLKIRDYIEKFIEYVENRNVNRTYFLLLKGFIYTEQTKCTRENCPLKKYLISLENGNDSSIFLYQYIEMIYQENIKKFEYSVELKISYILFSIQKFKKKQIVLKLINEIQSKDLSLEHEFLLFRLKKMCEDELSEIDSDNTDNIDVIKKLEYKNLTKKFNEILRNSISLYQDFWNNLISSHLMGEANIVKLNQIGSKINLILEDINTTFNNIQKIKKNNFQLLNIYAAFNEDILNDKNKAYNLRKIMIELDLDENENEENNYYNNNNININKLLLNDNFEFILVSGSKKNFGHIKNVSLGICSIFGYLREELIDKNLDILMPEIYKTEHHKLLIDNLHEYKKNHFVENFSTNNFDIKEHYVFGITKTKYLLHFLLKSTIIETEDYEYDFIASLNKENIFLHTNHSNYVADQYYILTDNNLIIKYFSANCTNFLEIDNNLLSNNIEITNFIKQFYEFYLNEVIDKAGELTNEQKLQIKKNILINKFKQSLPINWRKIEPNNSSNFNSAKLEFHKNAKSITNNNIFCFLSVKESIINHKVVGFVFKFEKAPKNKIDESSKHLINFKKKYERKSVNYSSDFINQIQGFNNNNILTHQKTSIKKNSINSTNNYLNVFDNNNNSSSMNLKIFPDTIPDSNFNFHFNINTLVYKGKNEITDSLREILKDEVIKKLEIQKDSKNNSNDNNSSSVYSENGSGSYSSSSDYSQSNNNIIVPEKEEEEEEKNELNENNIIQKSENLNDISLQKQKTIEKFIKQNSIKVDNMINNNNLIYENYYHVQLDKIIYLKYNYHKKMCIEDTEYKKISEVTKKINEASQIQNKPSFQSKPSSKFQSPIIKKNTNSHETTKDTPKQKNSIFQEISFEKEGDNILFKEIDYALKSNETHYSIKNLQNISIISFIILLSIGILSLYLVLNKISILKENCHLIFNSYLLIAINSYGTYYVKEKILLNNENYTNIPTTKSREEYIQFINSNILDTFFTHDRLLNEILESDLTISKKRQKVIDDCTAIVESIKPNYSINRDNIKCINLMNNINIALLNCYHMSISESVQTNFDIFYYIRNSLNSFINLFYEIGDLYLEEEKSSIKNFSIVLIIFYIILLLLLVGIYFIIYYYYKLSALKKSSYIEIFFEIGIDLIKSSIEKCDAFEKKFFKNDENKNDDDDYFENNYEENNLIFDSTILNNSKKNNSVLTKNNDKDETKDISIFRKYFIAFLIIIVLIFTLVSLIFIDFMKDLKLWGIYFKNQITSDNVNNLIFNYLRETVFDSDSYSNKTQSIDSLIYILNNAYEIRRTTISFMQLNRHKLPNNFDKLYRNLKKINPCYYRLDIYFADYDECINYFDGSIKLGFEIIKSHVIEEIRNNLHIYNNKTSEIRNNLTLTNTEIWAKSWPNEPEKLKNYIQNDPINFFNTEIHLHLNIVYQNILTTYLQELKNLTFKTFGDWINNQHMQYIVLLLIYISYILIIYIFIWRPIINNLSKLIIKTKKMLKIIPKEILSNINNISKLLDLEINDKNVISTINK